MDQTALRDIRRSKTLIFVGSFVALATVAIAIFASWILYQQTLSLLTKNLRERLLSISETAAVNIDPESLAKLQTESDWQKPEWKEVVSRLKKMKEGNDRIVFMYIFRKTAADPTQMEFVADAESINPYANTDSDPTNDVDANKDGIVEPDGADKLQWPGQPYPEAVDIPEAYEAYNGPITARDLYEDSYGKVLTGYAPIRDQEGNIVAVIATDIKADDFAAITTQTLYPFILFIIFLSLVIVVQAGTLIVVWKRRADELVAFSQQLETANKQQEILIHFIGHEVKGFLSKDSGAFASLSEGDFGPLPDTMKGFVSQALAQARLGVDSVSNILKAANLKKGTVAYEKMPFDLKALAAEAVERARPLADHKGLVLTFTADEGDYQMTGDKGQISDHVLRNLIDNSINYTPSGSIAVSLKKEDAKLMFTVKDTGVGITDEDKKHLFTEGGHGKDSQTINVHSTGYGLYIAKQITEAHGGTIRAESEGAGKGSTFVVEFPIG